MRHVTVRRAATLLGLVLLACAGLFAWTVSREPAAAPADSPRAAANGAALYERHCAACHTAEDLRPGVTAARRAALEAFLADHGDASAEEDRLILDYLSGGASNR